MNAEDAAFGGSPGANLVVASTDLDHWRRAVALSAQGRYARARAEIARMRTSDDAVRSLALSAQASWLRQLGWHRIAAESDGAAVRLAMSAGGSDLRVEALSDALTGLAADAIGQWRPSVTRALLVRVHQLLDGRSAERFWRARVRLSWVSAEAALAAGDGPTALRHAESAVDRARAAGAVRHEIKSELLVAASTTAIGQLSQAEALAGEIVERCANHGLLPLEWAASMLMAGVTGSSAARDRAHGCAAVIEHRGGRFR